MRWPTTWIAWRSITGGIWRELVRDNISIAAAGVAFYGFLAFVPFLASTVLIYGLAADPKSIEAVAGNITAVVPGDVASIILEQLKDMITTASDIKGWALVFALATSLYGAMRASSALIAAMNMVHNVDETRSFFRLNALTFVMTLGLILTAIFLVVLLSTLTTITALIGDNAPMFAWLGRGILLLSAGAVLSLMVAIAYRVAPNRPRTKWIWITPGSTLATVGALILTVGFSAYVANFANYNATYGAMAAVVIFLLWLYLLAYLFCLGAELNSQIESYVIPV